MKPEEIENLIEEYVDETEVSGERRVQATTDKERYLSALQTLSDSGLYHITTISGTDMGDEFEIIYHVDCGEGTLLDLSINVSKDDGTVPTISGTFPGAQLYELELQDLLGIEIENHPNSRKLVLADDWPENKHPLRKGMFNYRELADKKVSEIKDIAKDEDFEPEIMLEVEKENKNRKTLVEWLENRVEESEEEEEE